MIGKERGLSDRKWESNHSHEVDAQVEREESEEAGVKGEDV